MATRNVEMTITYLAWDTSANAGKTGDVGNHTLRWVKDGTSSAPTTSASEVDATTAPGIYKITMTATETDANIGVLCGKSSTSDITIVPITLQFERLPDADPAANGGLPTVDANNHVNGVQDTLDVNVTTIEGSDATDQINAACDTALADYDAPTKAEMDSAFSTTDGKIDVVDGIVDDILVDTGTTLPATLSTILSDTGELQTDWADGGRLDLLLDSAISKIDVVDGIVDDILVDTAVIGAAGAGLTGVPWNPNWDAQVESEVTDALNAYDPPTKTEMDAMWTSTQVESYAADGAEATPAELLYMILCAVSQFSISGTTITGKEVDGTTTAMTWTIDDASNPTLRTRAT